MAEQVELARCELFMIGAKQSDDPAAANAMFEQGYEALNDYIDSNPDAANRGDAEASLVSLSEDYAASIDARWRRPRARRRRRSACARPS